MADDACTERMDGRADGRTERKGCEQSSGHADGAHQARTRGWAEQARTGPNTHKRADGQTSGRADWAVKGGRAAVGWTGRTGGRGVRRSGEQADRRTGGPAGGPGFKRPYSTRLGSLLGTQSACLVRVRVRRVPGSAVGSSTIPHQTPVLSARTHLPCLSASVLDVENGILLFRYKNGFTQGRWQRDAKSMASSSCTKGRGWRRGQEKAKSGGLRARRVPQPGAPCVPGMGAAAAAMVSSNGHEVCRIPPLRPLVATHFTRTALQIEGCKILAS